MSLKNRHALPGPEGLDSPFAHEAFAADEGESGGFGLTTAFERAFDQETAGFETGEGPPAQEEETEARLRKKLKNLSFLPHRVESLGKDIPLSPFVIDPGFYEGTEKFKSDEKLQTCLKDAVKRAAVPNMKVALVDLTDESQPRFAGVRATDQTPVTNLPKLAVLLAAFQLQHDLRGALRDTGAKSLDDLFSSVRESWAKTQDVLKPKAEPFTRRISLKDKLVLVGGGPVALRDPRSPQLERIFLRTEDPVRMEFASTGENEVRLKEIADAFRDDKPDGKKNLTSLGFKERLTLMMRVFHKRVSDFIASTIVADLGFAYIASTLLQTGLFDPARGGGLWVGSDFGGVSWTPAPAGKGLLSATAGGVAAFLTLLVRDRLVDPLSCAEMRKIIEQDLLPGRSFVGFKEGLEKLPDEGSITTILSEGGNAEVADDCAFIERQVDDGSGGKQPVRYIAVGLGARKAELKTLIVELDKCIRQNNGFPILEAGEEETRTYEPEAEPEFPETEAEDQDLAMEEEVGRLGRGTRARVSDTTAVPYRWICSVAVAQRHEGPGSPTRTGEAPLGTGVLISPCHVLTAAHVLWSKDEEGGTVTEHIPESASVTLARDENNKPFGEVRAKSWKFHPKWKTTRSMAYDYAVITLEKRVGDMTFRSLRGQPLCYWGSPKCGGGTVMDTLPDSLFPKMLGAAMTTAGYPQSENNQMWVCTGKITAGTDSMDANLIRQGNAEAWARRSAVYRITADAEKGQSGSPVRIIDQGKRYLVGIVVDASEVVNYMLVLNDEVLGNIREWMGEAKGGKKADEFEEETELPGEASPFEAAFSGEAGEEEGGAGDQELLLAQEMSEWLPQYTPEYGEADEAAMAEEVPPLPKGVAKFEHFFQPMKLNAAGTLWVKDSGEKLLEPINPGFVDDRDVLVTDGLQTALADLLIGHAEFNKFLTKEAVRDGKPQAGDRIHVALVDLTKKKLLRPEFAGWGSTVAVDGASCLKVAPLYAAFELLNDLKHQAARDAIKTTVDLIGEAEKRWTDAGIEGFPDLSAFLKPGADPPDLAFSDDVKIAIDNIINNDHHDPNNADHSATVLIRVIGFPYIASLMWHSGLRHPVRGGLWLLWSFEEKGPVWSDPPRPAPRPVFGHTATALSLVTFFTLLAQKRLVNEESSKEMRKKLSTASWFRDILPSAKIASKVGLLLRCIKTGPKMKGGKVVLGKDKKPVMECKESISTHAHEAGLIENGELFYAVALMTVGIDHGVAVLKQLIKAVDDVIRARNP